MCLRASSSRLRNGAPVDEKPPIYLRGYNALEEGIIIHRNAALSRSREALMDPPRCLDTLRTLRSPNDLTVFFSLSASGSRIPLSSYGRYAIAIEMMIVAAAAGDEKEKLPRLIYNLSTSNAVTRNCGGETRSRSNYAGGLSSYNEFVIRLSRAPLFGWRLSRKLCRL